MQQRPWSRRFVVAVVFTMVVTWMCVPGLTVGNEVGGDVRVSRPTTVVSRLELPLAEPASGLVLGGFTAETASGPGVLAVTWSRQQSGWLPVWGVQLVAVPGTLPEELGPLRGTGFLDGTEYAELYVTGRPNWGHTLELWLAYDPDAGDVSLWIEDVTDSNVLYKGQFTVNAPADDMYVMSGASQAELATQVAVETVVYPDFIHRALDWQLVNPAVGELTSGALAGRTVDRSLPGTAVSLHAPEAAVGTLHIMMEQDEGVEQVVELRLPNDAQSTPYPVDVANWPSGQSTLVLEYVYDGKTVFSQRKQVAVGRVAVEFGQDLNLIRDDTGRQRLAGTVMVIADGVVPDFHIDLDYDVRTPRLTTPLHDQWVTAAGSLRIPVTDVDANKLVYPFELPFEAMGNLGLNREIYVSVSGTVATTVDVTAHLPARFVVGPRLAAFPPLDGYNVLRADLHSHTTLSDGSLTPNARAWESYMYGYDVLAMTDHRTSYAYDVAGPLAESIGLVLIPGMETGRHYKEHLIVLDLDEGYQTRDEHDWASARGEARVYYQDQVEQIVQHGGMIILAHPGWPEVEYDHPEAHAGWNEAVEWMIRNGYLHGVEIRQYQGRERDVAYRWALDYGLTIVEASDVHDGRQFSDPYGASVTLILATDSTREGVMEALRAGRTAVVRNGELRGKEEWLDVLIDGVIDLQPETVNGNLCLRLTNRSSLSLRGLATVQRMDSSQRLFLTPFASVCLAWDGKATGVDVSWTNAWSGPDTLLESTFFFP